MEAPLDPRGIPGLKGYKAKPAPQSPARGGTAPGRATGSRQGQGMATVVRPMESRAFQPGGTKGAGAGRGPARPAGKPQGGKKGR